MLKIKSVDKNSVGRELRLKAGYEITRFNGESVADILDYEYYDSQETFTMTVSMPDGETVFDIEKDADETLGLNFEEYCYLTEPRPCRNNCIFCFVAQLPRGMRGTLYVKDDDWRYSFVSGTYVTLTNLADGELERIITKKFSPIYVSVHATDDAVRRRLLGNPSAPELMPVLRALANGGIKIHTQVVVCAGYNDGETLKRTLEDLYSLFPAVGSVALVPVGLTSHRQGLTPLSPLTSLQAGAVIDLADVFNARAVDETGERFAFCSDEMYLRACQSLPTFEFYGDFDQIENGVGLIAKFRREFEDGVSLAHSAKEGSFTIASGKDAFPFMEELISFAKTRFPALDAEAVGIRNDFFGETVTVSGLLTGRDLLEQLSATDLKRTVLLPRTTLREFESVFLDGMTPKELERQLERKILFIADGYELAATLFDGEIL